MLQLINLILIARGFPSFENAIKIRKYFRKDKKLIRKVRMEGKGKERGCRCDEHVGPIMDGIQ